MLRQREAKLGDGLAAIGEQAIAERWIDPGSRDDTCAILSESTLPERGGPTPRLPPSRSFHARRARLESLQPFAQRRRCAE